MKVLNFEYPDALHYWLERNMWALPLDDGGVRVGITAFGVHISGSFFMCRLKPVGTELLQGQTVALVELNKSVVTVKTPVSGVVRAINPLLMEHPEWIERDPYGQGWLAELTPTRWTEDRACLHHGVSVPEAAMQRMQLENLDLSSEASS